MPPKRRSTRKSTKSPSPATRNKKSQPRRRVQTAEAQRPLRETRQTRSKSETPLQSQNPVIEAQSTQRATRQTRSKSKSPLQSQNQVTTQLPNNSNAANSAGHEVSEDFSLNDWTLPGNINRDGLQSWQILPSILPSPFMKIPNTLDDRSHERLRILFQRARDKELSLETEILERDEGEESHNIHVCLQISKQSIEDLDRRNHHDIKAKSLFWPSKDFTILIPMSTSSATVGSENPKDDSVEACIQLKIIRSENLTTGDIGHFVVNDFHEDLAINNSRVPTNVLTGPLPDFAVITVGSAAVLWWSTAKAWYYDPEPKVMNHSQDPVDRNLQRASGTKRKRDPRTVWADELTAGLKHFYTQKLKSDENRERKSSLGDNESREVRANQIRYLTLVNLFDDDVLTSIGCIWDPLRRFSKGARVFAFAGLDVFSDTKGELKGHGVVGNHGKFIMPLYFHEKDLQIKPSSATSSKSDAGSIGHWILATAEVVQEGGTDGIRGISIEIFDSALGIVHLDYVREIAIIKVKTSGWKGYISDQETPILHCNRIETPRQVGGNTCGLFTILNAWAIMLDIPISTSEDFLGKIPVKSFMRRAREVVNLARWGSMNARNIQAFMNACGYSEFQDPDQENVTPYPIEAVSMSNERLREVLYDQKNIDDFGPNAGADLFEDSLDEATPSARLDNSNHPGRPNDSADRSGSGDESGDQGGLDGQSSTSFDKEKTAKIDSLLKPEWGFKFVNREMVIDALEYTNWDVALAGTRLYTSPSPEPQNPAIGSSGLPETSPPRATSPLGGLLLSPERSPPKEKTPFGGERSESGDTDNPWNSPNPSEPPKSTQESYPRSSPSPSGPRTPVRRTPPRGSHSPSGPRTPVRKIPLRGLPGRFEPHTPPEQSSPPKRRRVTKQRNPAE